MDSTNKKLIGIAVALLILMGIVGAVKEYQWNKLSDLDQVNSGYGLGTDNDGRDQVVCTADAMECPDGSYVGRVAPDCSFALCPETQATSTGSNPGTIPVPNKAQTGTLNGVVTLGPVCPVEPVPADPNCAPKPYSTTVVLTDPSTNKEIARTKSTSAGAYSFVVAPGDYILTAIGGSMFPRCPSLSATVVKNSSVKVNISCDTGIR